MKRRSILEINDGTVKISNCGRYIACGNENILKIVNSKSADVVSTFSCSHSIKNVDWHFGSNHVLSVMANARTVQAFSLSDPDWFCTIQTGELALKNAKWGPRGHYILTVAEFGVRISVWSLTGESVCYIDNPIIRKNDELTFSEDGNYFAALIGAPEEYKIIVYCTESWNVIKKIECTQKISMPSNPLWSPSNLHLVIGEMTDLKCLFLEVYSLEKSKLMGMFMKTRRRKFCKFSVLRWIANGQFLLAGCHDEKVYVLNHVTWGLLAVLNHTAVIKEEKCAIYMEVMNKDVFEVIRHRPVSMSKVRATVKGGLIPGVTRIISDFSSRYVLTQCASMPAVAFIWEIGDFRLKSVIILHTGVIDAVWHPENPKLMICSGSKRISVWTPSVCSHIRFSSTETGLPFVRNCFWCPGKNNFSIVASSLLYILH